MTSMERLSLRIIGSGPLRVMSLARARCPKQESVVKDLKNKRSRRLRGSANEICKSTISFMTGDPSKVRLATEWEDGKMGGCGLGGWGTSHEQINPFSFAQSRDYCRIQYEGSLKDSADHPRFLPGSERIRNPRKMTRLIGK
jgi:hypothetical protein